MFILERNALVDDTIVEGLSRLIRLEHPAAIGLESPTLRFYNVMRKAEVLNNHGIAHIYHNGRNHFVSAVQTCAEYVEFCNSIYDKKPSPPTPKVLEQMKLNFKIRDKKGRLPIRSYSVQKQSPGNLDCGIYSAVNTWLLLSHVDPGKFEVDEKSLRSKVLSSFCSNGILQLTN